MCDTLWLGVLFSLQFQLLFNQQVQGVDIAHQTYSTTSGGRCTLQAGTRRDWQLASRHLTIDFNKACGRLLIPISDNNPHMPISLGPQNNRRLTVKKLAMCKGTGNLPMIWYDVALKRNEETKQLEFYLKVNVTKEVSPAFSMTFNFLKCDASGNPDSCEYLLRDYKNNEICKFLTPKNQKNQAWSTFFEYLDRPLRCPLEPGVYKLVKCPMKTDLLRYLPVSDALWKIKFWGHDNEKPVSCVDMEVQIISTKRGYMGG